MKETAFRIVLEAVGDTFDCGPDQTVLSALSSSFKRNIPTGCRGGGCGICRIHVLSGVFATGHMSSVHIRPEDLADGIALACQVYPRSDLRIRVLPRRSETAVDPVSSGRTAAELGAGAVARGI